MGRTSGEGRPQRRSRRDGEVIAHSKQPLYCLLLSFEGRRSLLLRFQLIFQWDVGIPEQHCASIAQRVLGLYSNKAYQSPRGTHTHTAYLFICCISAFISVHRRPVTTGAWTVMFVVMFTIGIFSLPGLH